MVGLSKVKCINGYDNDFVTLFLDDGRDLLNALVFALPFVIEQKIIPAHFTSACRRLRDPFRIASSTSERLVPRSSACSCACLERRTRFMIQTKDYNFNRIVFSPRHG